MPVTLITGCVWLLLVVFKSRAHLHVAFHRHSFLGAGKSTLVSHVLHAQHGWRIAVVVNELGQGLSVGLERTLVQDSAG